MPIRIAIGSSRCSDGIRSPNSVRRELCSRILARLERLRSLAPEALARLPALTSDVERIEGRMALLITCRDKLETGDDLVVVRGFLRSWRFPTYIGTDGVGYCYAEGIVVGSDGRIRDPEANLLWHFR